MTRTSKLALNTAVLACATLAITSTASTQLPDPIVANPLTRRHASLIV